MIWIQAKLLTRSLGHDLSSHEPYPPVQNVMIPIFRQRWTHVHPHDPHQLNSLNKLCVVYVHAKYADLDEKKNPFGNQQGKEELIK